MLFLGNVFDRGNMDLRPRKKMKITPEYYVGGPGLDFETWVFRSGPLRGETQGPPTQSMEFASFSTEESWAFGACVRTRFTN